MIRLLLPPGALLLWSACAAPPPLAEPASQPVVVYQRLAAAAGEGDAASRDAASWRLEVLALTEAPAGAAVDRLAEALPSERGEPFRGASALPPGSRLLTGDEVAAWSAARAGASALTLQVLGELAVVAAAGLRARIATPGLPSLELEHHDGHTFLRLLAAGDDADAGAVRIAPGFANDAAALLFVPATPGARAGRALLLQGAGTAPGDEVARVFASTDGKAPDESRWPPAWRVAQAAIGQHNRRPALLALATPLALDRVIDILLAADERALISITAGLAPVDPHAPDVGWQLERSVWLALLRRHERDDLSDALHGVFLRHLGAMANDPAALRHDLQAARDANEFLAALLAGNQLALADREPAQRIRGHDWLSARQRAVADYQPLAPVDERRRALRAVPAEAPAAAETPAGEKR